MREKRGKNSEKGGMNENEWENLIHSHSFSLLKFQQAFQPFFCGENKRSSPFFVEKISVPALFLRRNKRSNVKKKHTKNEWEWMRFSHSFSLFNFLTLCIQFWVGLHYEVFFLRRVASYLLLLLLLVVVVVVVVDVYDVIRFGSGLILCVFLPTGWVVSCCCCCC